MSLAKFRPFVVALAVFAGVLTGASLPVSAASAADPASLSNASLDALHAGDRIPGRYIVVFKDSVADPRSLARGQSEYHGGKLGFLYRHAIEGYAVSGISQTDVEALRRNPQVSYVTPDRVVEAEEEPGEGEEPGFEAQAEGNEGEEAEGQVVPTGIERISAPANEKLHIDGRDDFRVNADVAVIDSGIDPQNPDLNVVARTNCVTSENGGVEGCVDGSGNDGLGHATHVAGTIGAIDNGFGVVGVAPGVRLWSVKILNASGFGSTSQELAGIEWVTAHAGQIEAANLSIGCGSRCSRPELNAAIEASAKAGVVFAIAAGNEADNVQYYDPPGNPDAITVSALADYDGRPGGEGPTTCASYGSDDTLASFSNYGKEVNVAAPGVCIYSTQPGGGYAFKSGTSMATPHVAGAAALLASTENPEDLEDVKAIRRTIEEHGSQAWKDTSGDGVQEPLLDVGDEEAFAPTDAHVSTGKAEILTPTEATLHGAVNPDGLETEYSFEYGPTAEYGSATPLAAAGAGTEYTEVEATLAGLEAGTPYHYRLVATNSEGTFHGADRTFGGAAGPLAYSGGASEGEPGEVTFEGTVDPEGSETNYYIEASLSNLNGFLIPPVTKTPVESVGSGDSDVAISQTVTGLNPEKAYYYRLVAENAHGSGHGLLKVLPKAPLATTETATDVDFGAATLHAMVNSNGVATKYHFEYDTAEYKEGEEAAHGTSVPVPDGAFPPLAGARYSEERIEGLEAGAVYHYRVVATNEIGTTYGKDKTFETEPITSPTTLCNSGAESPACPSAQRYPSQTAIEAGTSGFALQTSLGTVACGTSHIAAKSLAQTGDPLALQVTGWTFGQCLRGTETCTVTSLNLPGEASLAWSEGDAGSLAVPSGGEAQPKLKVECGPYIKCTYAAPGGISLGGGAPAQLALAEGKLTKLGSGLCPSTNTLKAVAYAVEAPTALYVGLATSTTLCNSGAESPACPSAQRYPSQTAIEAGTSGFALQTSLGTVACGTSHIAAKSQAQTGDPLALQVTGWTFGECLRGTETCTVTSLNLPGEASLAWSEGDAGSLAVPSGGEAQPKLKVECGLYIKCTYAAPGGISLGGGAPAQLALAEGKLTKLGSGLCPSTNTLKAVAYAVEAPKALYVGRVY